MEYEINDRLIELIMSWLIMSWLIIFRLIMSWLIMSWRSYGVSSGVNVMARIAFVAQEDDI